MEFKAFVQIKGRMALFCKEDRNHSCNRNDVYVVTAAVIVIATNATKADEQ
jgi:hypothetical protein